MDENVQSKITQVYLDLLQKNAADNQQVRIHTGRRLTTIKKGSYGIAAYSGKW